jgi:cytochrome P450
MSIEAVPGPKGVPFLGNALQFAANPPKFIMQLVSEYGDIAKMRMFGKTIYVLAHPDYIHEVLVSKQELFPKAARETEIISRFLGYSLPTINGDTHQQRRKLVQPAFHAKYLQSYAKTMTTFAAEMCDQWQAGEVRDLSHELTTLTRSIVLKTLFGIDERQLNYDGQQIAAAIQTMKGVIQADVESLLLWPEWIPTKRNRRRHAARTILYETIHRLIAERQRISANEQATTTCDLMSMLLATTYEDGQVLEDGQIRDELISFFVAGHETTSMALIWTWYLLSQHPKVEAKLHAEIDAVLNGRLPTIQDYPQLQYTQMVLKEAMRLYPPVWIMIAREAAQNTTIGEHAIRKGDMTFTLPYVIHRLPQYFPDPERFDPERFTPENEARLPRYAYIPFGAGPHVCIGSAFAMMEATLIVAIMAQKFRFRLTPNQIVEPNPMATLSPKYGMRMYLTARRPQRAETAVVHQTSPSGDVPAYNGMTKM